MPTFKTKIKNGFHIPLEICDNCEIKEDCQTDKKECESLNKRRIKIIDYIKGFGMDNLIVYQNPYQMHKNLKIFTNRVWDQSGTFEYNNQIAYILVKNKDLQIIYITHDAELLFIEELEKTTKIDFIVNIMTGEYD